MKKIATITGFQSKMILYLNIFKASTAKNMSLLAVSERQKDKLCLSTILSLGNLPQISNSVTGILYDLASWSTSRISERFKKSTYLQIR